MKKEADDADVVFVKSFFHRGLNRRIYAWQYGKKAFALRKRKDALPQ